MYSTSLAYFEGKIQSFEQRFFLKTSTTKTLGLAHENIDLLHKNTRLFINGSLAKHKLTTDLKFLEVF